MGNREALIEGAVTCLKEKGCSRTTARDIATAAGVSLAKTIDLVSARIKSD